jgi:hypothetical protein
MEYDEVDTTFGDRAPTRLVLAQEAIHVQVELWAPAPVVPVACSTGVATESAPTDKDTSAP